MCLHASHGLADDYGIKHNILRRLASFGCRSHVVPADYPADKVRPSCCCYYCSLCGPANNGPAAAAACVSSSGDILMLLLLQRQQRQSHAECNA